MGGLPRYLNFIKLISPLTPRISAGPFLLFLFLVVLFTRVIYSYLGDTIFISESKPSWEFYKFSQRRSEWKVTGFILRSILGRQDGNYSPAGLIQNVTALNENLSSPSLAGLVQTFQFQTYKTFHSDQILPTKNVSSKYQNWLLRLQCIMAELVIIYLLLTKLNHIYIDSSTSWRSSLISTATNNYGRYAIDKERDYFSVHLHERCFVGSFEKYSQFQVIMDHKEEPFYGEEVEEEEGEPYFEVDSKQTNLSSVVGAVARLTCSVHKLGIKTVSQIF